MAANVESMGFVGAKPWHGLGTDLSEADLYNLDVFKTGSGLDWYVDALPMFRMGVVDHDNGFGGVVVPQLVKTGRVTVRTSDDSELGIIGPRSRILQNSEAFEFFRPFLDTKQAALHTAGSLDEGRRVWVLAKLALENATIVEGDSVEKYVMLSNAHDGTMAVRVGFTPIRIVCANTLAMAHKSDASKLLRVKHTRNMADNLADIQATMNLANQEFEATVEQYRRLASKSINQDDIKKYVRQVFNKTEDEDTSKQFKTLADEITMLANIGRGNQLKGVAGTLWAAYNGLTEYLNYNRGHNTATRLQSLWFGQSAETNKRALEVAYDMAS